MADNYSEVIIDFQKENGPFRLEQADRSGVISSQIYFNNELVKTFEQLKGDANEKNVSDIPLTSQISQAHQYIADELVKNYPEHLDTEMYYNSEENFERDVPLEVINEYVDELLEITNDHDHEFKIKEEEYIRRLESYANECELYGLAQTTYAEAELNIKQYESELNNLRQEEKAYYKDQETFDAKKKPPFYKVKAVKAYKQEKNILDERQKQLAERRAELTDKIENAMNITRESPPKEPVNLAKNNEVAFKENLKGKSLGQYINRLETYVEGIKDYTINKLENIREYTDYIDAVKDVKNTHDIKKESKVNQHNEKTISGAEKSMDNNKPQNEDKEKVTNTVDNTKEQPVKDKENLTDKRLNEWKIKLDEQKELLDRQKSRLEQQKTELNEMKQQFLQQQNNRTQTNSNRQICDIKKDLNSLKKSLGSDYKIRINGLDDRDLSSRISEAREKENMAIKISKIKSFKQPSVKIMNIYDSYYKEAQNLLGKNEQWSKENNVEIAKKLLLSGFEKEKVVNTIAKLSPVKVEINHAKNIVNMVSKNHEIGKQIQKVADLGR